MVLLKYYQQQVCKEGGKETVGRGSSGSSVRKQVAVSSPLTSFFFRFQRDSFTTTPAPHFGSRAVSHPVRPPRQGVGVSPVRIVADQ